jgi:prevent-host-death family protein
MKTVKIAELRNSLSRYLDHVRAGGRVVILDRDQPVAEIVPIGTSGKPDTDLGHLDALERKGIVRKARGKLSGDLLSGPLPGKDADVLGALLEERRKSS